MRSKRILLYDENKIKLINPDTTKKYYIKQDTAKIGTAKAMFNI